MQLRSSDGHFSIEIPDSWCSDDLAGVFSLSGGRYSFSSPDGARGMVNIAVAKTKYVLPRLQREGQLKFYLKWSGFFLLQWRASIEVVNRRLGGENDTAWA